MVNKKEFNIIISICSLLCFMTAHFLYPTIGSDELAFMGFYVGNLIVDIFLLVGIILQIYIIIILSRK